MARSSKTTAVSTIVPNATIVPRMLVVADAARYLGIGAWAMRHLHWDGKLRGVFIGRRLVFDRVELDKYVEHLKQGAAA
jgi:excisionase family DNA binding protein